MQLKFVINLMVKLRNKIFSILVYWKASMVVLFIGLRYGRHLVIKGIGENGTLKIRPH